MNRLETKALQDWWADTAAGDGQKVIPKAAEYASGDLTEVGRTMARLAGIEVEDEAHATELGIYFYALGKMARWTAAVEGGRRVSDDTLLDLTTYMMMARRVRDVGGWPWADGEPPEPAPTLADAILDHYAGPKGPPGPEPAPSLKGGEAARRVREWGFRSEDEDEGPVGEVPAGLPGYGSLRD